MCIDRLPNSASARNHHLLHNNLPSIPSRICAWEIQNWKNRMSQNGKLMPNLDQHSTKLLNLTVLQRIDPFVEEILITAAHVTFYEFNIELSQWVCQSLYECTHLLTPLPFPFLPTFSLSLVLGRVARTWKDLSLLSRGELFYIYTYI